MNRRYSTIMTVTAVAVMAGALFGQSFTANSTDVYSSDYKVDAYAAIDRMGGLQLIMTEAYAV